MTETTEYKLSDLVAALGARSLGDVLVQIAKGKLAAEDVETIANEAVEAGRVQKRQRIASVKHRPFECPERAAMRDSKPTDGTEKGEGKKLREKGAVAQFERLHYRKVDDLMSLGCTWRESWWAALNELCCDQGEVGVVARACRLGMVQALREVKRRREA